MQGTGPGSGREKFISPGKLDGVYVPTMLLTSDACVKESGEELRGMPMLDWREECAE